MDALSLTAATRVGFDRLPGNWRLSRLIVHVARPPLFDAGVSLPSRLRGTLGHALLARKADAEWDAARRILFETVPWRARAQLPKPFLIDAQEAGDRLRLSLTLFGVADRWRQAIFDAFLEGLARGVAADVRDGAPRRALTVLAADWIRTESITVPPPRRAARLLFRTPLRLGGGHKLGHHWGDIVVSLAERAAGLAVWQGLRVEPALGEWRALANTLDFLDGGLWPVAWSRRSGAQGGREIPMSGFLGPLDICRPPEQLMLLLALGETSHVGGGASLGLGRYDLV